MKLGPWGPSDPHLFSESAYEHTSAKDDADVAEEEDEDENDGEADDFKHGLFASVYQSSVERPECAQVIRDDPER